MILLLLLLAAVAVTAALAAASLARLLRRAGHRCTERTLPSGCDRCAAVLRGTDRGGHLVCGCGATSPHLVGAELLAWGAEHHGETLPPLPVPASAPVLAEEPEPAEEPGPAVEPGLPEPPEVDKPWTTRGAAAAQERDRVRQALAEELSETQRRMIHRARTRPDPLTPQVLREAEEIGFQPPVRDSAIQDDRAVQDDQDLTPGTNPAP